MEQKSREKIKTKRNLNLSESIQTKFKNPFSEEKKRINIFSNDNKIVLYKDKNNNKINELNYKTVIKKIAHKLKKRVKFPKCKIFKFYMKNKLLILRIAQRIKKSSKKTNILEKWEKIKNDKINEIDSSNSKLIQEDRKKKLKEKIFNSFEDKNIEINLSLFTKNEKNEIINNHESEIDNLLIDLKNINIKGDNTNNFLDEFSSFLEKYNIQICPETKLPLFKNTNNMYLLKQNEFWIKYILFISNKYKDNLTIYTFLYFIEHFYIWNDSNINEDFNTEIKNQIKILFNEETINNFLILYKIKNLDELFERYKYLNRNINLYKEIKIDGYDCCCPTCKYEGLLEKVINYNKKNNKLSLTKNNNTSFTINPTNKNNLNKNNNGNTNKNKSINNYKESEN